MTDPLAAIWGQDFADDWPLTVCEICDEPAPWSPCPNCARFDDSLYNATRDDNRESR